MRGIFCRIRLLRPRVIEWGYVGKLEEKETERRRLREEMARNRGDVQQANRIN
jgi:hypothetical protein